MLFQAADSQWEAPVRLPQVLVGALTVVSVAAGFTKYRFDPPGGTIVCLTTVYGMGI